MEFEAHVKRKGWFVGQVNGVDAFSDDDAKAAKIAEPDVDRLAAKYGNASVSLKLANNGAGA